MLDDDGREVPVKGIIVEAVDGCTSAESQSFSCEKSAVRNGVAIQGEQVLTSFEVTFKQGFPTDGDEFTAR